MALGTDPGRGCWCKGRRNWVAAPAATVHRSRPGLMESPGGQGCEGAVEGLVEERLVVSGKAPGVSVGSRKCTWWLEGEGQGGIRREGTSEAAPEAVRSAVGGGCRSGWGRFLSVTNAVEAGSCRQGDSGWAWAGRPGGGGPGGCPPPPSDAFLRGGLGGGAGRSSDGLGWVGLGVCPTPVLTYRSALPGGYSGRPARSSQAPSRWTRGCNATTDPGRPRRSEAPAHAHAHVPTRPCSFM